MNINFLFTFLGQPGGIPVLQEAFLSIAENKNGRENLHFSLSTYVASTVRPTTIPVLAMQRGKMIENIFRYRQFLRKNNTDIVFYHYHTFPLFLCGKPYIIEIHDINPLSEFSARIATALNALWARAIIVPSLSTKEKLASSFYSMGLGFLKKKLIFTPGLISPTFWAILENPPMNKLVQFSIAPNRYFFTTGSDDLPFLCRCVTEASSYPLIISGTIPAKIQDALTSQYGSRVRFLGFVDTLTLAALYAGARALLYKNSNEGFGLIPLEAAIAGTRVIANPDGSIEGTLGNAGLYYRNQEECKMLIKDADIQSERPPRPPFQRYRAETVFDEYLKIFKNIISHRHE